MTDFSDFLGIDIGTTSVKIAYFDKKQNQVINVTFKDGDEYYPSYYAVHKKTGKGKTGKDAKTQMASPNFFVIYEVKRFIGKKYDDETIGEEKNRVTYKVLKNPDDGTVLMQIGPQRSITPSDFYQVILKEIRALMESQGIKAKNAVVTVPVTFGDTERELIRNMVKSPEFGMNTVEIFNEPTAAAIDCGIKDGDFSGMFAIFDYGGGTLDVSVIELTKDEEGTPSFEVIRHGGLRGNGGSDLDQLIVNKILSDIKEGIISVEDVDETLKFLKGNKGSARLKKECEDCKIALSSETTYQFNLPLENDEDEEVSVTITRNEFETDICGQKFEEAVECLQNVIAEAEDEKNEKVKKILMVGGSSQIPFLKTLIQEKTGIEPQLSEKPLLAVSRGAALQGSSVDIKTKERSPYAVGIEITEQGLPLIYTIIEKNTPLPVIGEYTFRIPNDGQDCMKTWVYKDAKLPERDKRIGAIEMYMDNYVPKINDRVVLRVEMTEEGCLTLTFTLPDSQFGNTFVKNIEINTK